MFNREIIILGHSGFIGKALFEHFSSEGVTPRGVSSKEIDLRDPESTNYLEGILTPESTLIFSAALIRQRGDNLQTLQDNIRLASNVATVLENHRLKKCIYLSTTDVYGQPMYPISEDSPINPQTYYAAAKFCSESILQTACRRAQTPILILRYGGIFGLGQKEPRYGPNSFVETALKEGVIKLWGDGEELRDMVYVKDLAKATSQLTKGDDQGIMNVATGIPTTFLGVAEVICSLLSPPIRIVHQDRSGPKFNQRFNPEKFRQNLPNFKFTPLKEALTQMVYNAAAQKQ